MVPVLTLTKLLVITHGLVLTRPTPVDTTEAGSQGRRVALSPSTGRVDIDALTRELNSPDGEKAASAAEALGRSGSPAAAEPLADLLAAGTTPWVAEPALDALRVLKDPRSIQVLVLYAGNRNLKVRLAAVGALGALSDPRVTGALLERLGDGDASVRAAAATALAKHVRATGEAQLRRTTVARLFKVVARNDAGAAAALGLLAPPDLVPSIAELRGRVDDAVIATTFGELLKRAEMPDRLRLDIIATLSAIPGPAATTALVEYLATIPESDARPSKDEAQRALDRRTVTP